MVNPVFDGKVLATLEAFYFTIHTPLGSALGRPDSCTVDQKFVFTLVIDFLVTLLFVRIVVGVAMGSTRQQCSTALASGQT